MNEATHGMPGKQTDQPQQQQNETCSSEHTDCVSLANGPKGKVLPSSLNGPSKGPERGGILYPSETPSDLISALSRLKSNPTAIRDIPNPPDRASQSPIESSAGKAPPCHRLPATDIRTWRWSHSARHS